MAKKEKNIWELIDGPGVKVDRFAPDNADAVRMMENLASQPKVRTRVPREAKEPVDAFISPIMNSVRINIRKGIAVELPEQVADMIATPQPLRLPDDDRSISKTKRVHLPADWDDSHWKSSKPNTPNI